MEIRISPVNRQLLLHPGMDPRCSFQRSGRARISIANLTVRNLLEGPCRALHMAMACADKAVNFIGLGVTDGQCASPPFTVQPSTFRATIVLALPGYLMCLGGTRRPQVVGAR